MSHHRWSRILFLFGAFGALLLFPLLANASDINESTVDATAPTDSVTLAPGSSGAITIKLSVTGSQEGTATFTVNRDWTLTGGTFTGRSSMSST